MTFEELNLNKPLRRALSDLEYVYPTPIQEKSFPVIMSGRNMVGTAQTGTGKTFAYLLPLLRQLPFSHQKDPRILILAPTRVLVVQILKEVNKLTQYTSLRSAGIYGDTNINTQKQLVYDGVDILVATPGRLIDIVFTGVLRLKFIQKLVIDEIDEMLSLGLRSQLSSVLDLLPQKRQTLMFSATFTADVEKFMADSIPGSIRIEIEPHGTPIDKIVQKAYLVPNFNTKVKLLELLLSANSELSRALVFVSSKKLAERLFEQLDIVFPEQIGIVHSNKAHNTRLTALKQFQEGAHRLLIATDVIARGMDIADVTHVINFDIPIDPEDYIHRIGRTGRADKGGIAISFINHAEQEYQHQIELLMNKQIQMEPLPENLEISKIFTEEEKSVNLYDKNYLKTPSKKDPKGAFHKKKEKNLKVNSGKLKSKKEKKNQGIKPKMTKKSRKTRF